MQQGSEDDAVPQFELVDARPRAAARIRNPVEDVIGRSDNGVYRTHTYYTGDYFATYVARLLCGIVSGQWWPEWTQYRL